MVTTWRAARSALVAALEEIPELDRVHAVAPPTPEGLRSGISAIVLPPSRSTSRGPGGRAQTVYQVEITLATPLGSNPVVSLDLDDAAEAVTAALESHITLGGEATSTDAPDWTDAGIEQYGPQSGIEFLVMRGAFPVTIIRTYERTA